MHVIVRSLTHDVELTSTKLSLRGGAFGRTDWQRRQALLHAVWDPQVHSLKRLTHGETQG